MLPIEKIKVKNFIKQICICFLGKKQIVGVKHVNKPTQNFGFDLGPALTETRRIKSGIFKYILQKCVMGLKHVSGTCLKSGMNLRGK